MVDWQSVATWGWTVVCGLLGWLMRELWGAVKKLREDLSALEKALPTDYMSKMDFQPLIQDLRQTLTRIEDKLDRKQDK